MSNPKMHENYMLALALSYVTQGFRIFPVGSSGDAYKLPLVKGWPEAATIDPDQIRKWWRAYPDALIGLLTGASNNLFVIDADIDKQTGEPTGVKTLENIPGVMKALGKPDVTSPSGGCHWYFCHHDGLRNSNKQIGPGVDTRGEGGYIIAGGSRLPDGRAYGWAEAPLDLSQVRPLPAVMLPLLERERPQRGPVPIASKSNANDRASIYALDAFNGCLQEVALAPDGQRNHTLNACAYRVGRFVGAGYLTEADASAQLQKAGTAAGLNGREAKATTESGLSNGMADPWHVSELEDRQSAPSAGGQYSVAVGEDEDPLPLYPPPTEGQRYPVDALGPLRPYVEAVQDITQAPMGIAANSALAVAALAVQALADVELLEGQSPTSLFALTIADSGERKSSCDKRLLKSIHDLECKRQKQFALVKSDWELQEAAYRKAQAAMARDKLEGNASANQVPLACPAQPLNPKMLASDPTAEGLLHLFGFSQPSLGVFTDEAAMFIGGYAMSKDNRIKTMGTLTKLWGGDPVDRTRRGDGSAAYYGRRLCCHLMGQPVVMEALLSDPIAQKQGFLARFLIVQPEPMAGTRRYSKGKSASYEAVKRFNNRIAELMALPQPVSADCSQELEPPLLRLSNDAYLLLIEYYDQVEVAQGEGGMYEQHKAFASRSAEQACRIAGVLTMFEDPLAKAIDLETMQNAITLARFYLSEVTRLIGVAHLSMALQDAEKLRQWLIAKGEEAISFRDITRKCRTKAKAEESVAILLAHGWLVDMPHDNPRKGAAYQVRTD